MSQWAARYVRLADRAADLARLEARAAGAGLVMDDGKSAFALWLLDAPRPGPDDLAALSKEFGEALALTVDIVADLVVYDHFVGGSRVRGLSYAGEAGWERVVGAPEPWEAAALFSATKLEELLLELEEDMTDDAFAQEKAEAEKLWSGGKLVEGSANPQAEPAIVVRAIEKHFRLPARPKG